MQMGVPLLFKCPRFVYALLLLRRLRAIRPRAAVAIESHNVWAVSSPVAGVEDLVVVVGEVLVVVVVVVFVGTVDPLSVDDPLGLVGVGVSVGVVPPFSFHCATKVWSPSTVYLSPGWYSDPFQ